MKERFSEFQWGLLRLFPYLLFALVAGADGVVDAKERDHFDQELAYPDHPDALQAELFADLRRTPEPRLAEEARRPELAEERLTQLRRFLSDILNEGEYNDFICSMYATCLRVAQASGGGWFGLGDPVSAKERVALQVFSKKFGIHGDILDNYFKKAARS